MTNKDEPREYVCGFLFFRQAGLNQIPIFATENDWKVLLILKDRPVWQAGKYNGIGGKIELGEKPIDAMIRECYEECGLRIDGWKQFATMEVDNGAKIHFYKAFADTVPQWQQKTSEPLASFPTHRLPANLINSNRYLIPMAMENDMTEAIIKTQ